MRAMTAASAAEGADSDWEYAPLRIPAGTTRTAAAAHLSLQAEFAGWELARLVSYTDGTRQVVLRRVRRTSPLPLPGLSV
jgi:hypothetical protein